MATQSSEKYEPNDHSNDVMGKLYQAYAEDKKQKEAATAKMGFPPPPTPLVPLPNYLKTGLEINLAGRKTSKLESTKVIHFKHERGNDPIAKKKTRDKVVKAIDPKLSTNNISRIITSKDAASFDVAADALSWQNLEDEDYFQWQEFLLRYNSVTEIESNAWLEDTLHLSM